MNLLTYIVTPTHTCKISVR